MQKLLRHILLFSAFFFQVNFSFAQLDTSNSLTSISEEGTITLTNSNRWFDSFDADDVVDDLGDCNYKIGENGAVENDELVLVQKNENEVGFGKKNLPDSPLSFIDDLDWTPELKQQLINDLESTTSLIQKFIDVPYTKKIELAGAWKVLHDAGKVDLRKSVTALETLWNIRKNPKLSDLGITDQMLGAIEGIPNVGYAQVLEDLDLAIKALPDGKTIDFYKVVSDGNRGLVNSNNVWDRRHSWLTLKKIKENETFLKKADEVRFEVELEQIDGVNHAVPDIVVTTSEGGITKTIIGEVKAGDNIITSNFNSQCLRYFNEITDIRNLRLFRRDGVTLTKQQVIDSWKSGGLLDDNEVFQLFQKYDIEVTQTYSLNVESQLESYLTANDEWFNLIFNSSF